MYRHQSICRPYSWQSLPERARPIVRYREEAFGYTAAFPTGRVALLSASARPLLDAGAAFEECAAHLLPRLTVPVDFHFASPLMAWLEITRQCNLRCPHCFTEGGTRRRGELSTPRILALLEEWAEMGVFTVVITGGEPTIHPDFLEITKHAHTLGFAVSIATNGMPLTDKLLADLPRDDVIISISIDEAHGQGAGRETDFQYVTRKLLAIRDQGFNTSIMTTTTRQNANDLQNVIEWAVDNNISLRSVPFVPMGRGALYDRMMNTTAEVESAARFWLAEEKWERVRDHQLGLCTGKVYNFLLTMVFATRRCMSGRGLCYVDSCGDVYPCTTCSGGKTLCAGNVQMQSFRDIWDGRWDIRQITWKDFETTCAGCPINADHYFCTGRCPGSSHVYNHTHNGCGMTEFLRLSVKRREELFRENIRKEPRVPVLPVMRVADAVDDQPG